MLQGSHQQKLRKLLPPNNLFGECRPRCYCKLYYCRTNALFMRVWRRAGLIGVRECDHSVDYCTSVRECRSCQAAAWLVSSPSSESWLCIRDPGESFALRTRLPKLSPESKGRLAGLIIATVSGFLCPDLCWCPDLTLTSVKLCLKCSACHAWPGLGTALKVTVAMSDWRMTPESGACSKRLRR